MRSSQVLEEAFALLDGGNAWTQGEYATDADGEIVDAGSAAAVRFCSVGALLHVTSRSPSAFACADARLTDAARAVCDAHALPRQLAASVNDTVEWPLVAEMWQRAIRAAHAAEAEQLNEIPAPARERETVA